MARYLSAQYSNKVPNNPRNKSGDRNSKKDDDSKSEDSNILRKGWGRILTGNVMIIQQKDCKIQFLGSTTQSFFARKKIEQPEGV